MQRCKDELILNASLVDFVKMKQTNPHRVITLLSTFGKYNTFYSNLTFL